MNKLTCVGYTLLMFIFWLSQLCLSYFDLARRVFKFISNRAVRGTVINLFHLLFLNTEELDP